MISNEKINPAVLIEYPYEHKDGMGTRLTYGLINYLCRKAKVYLEVGSYRGDSLHAAAWSNPDCRVIGIDNFSQFDKHGNNRSYVDGVVSTFENVEFIEGDYRKVLPALVDLKGAVDVYFFDGPHTFNDQWLGLELALPLLSDHACVIVDDVNWEDVRYPTLRWARFFGFDVVFERRTERNGSPDWWNGFMVLKRRQE